MTIRQATTDDLDLVVPLFDDYRQFYGRVSDLALARSFLAERLLHQQSVILLAFDVQQRAVGFTQLFPSFSSASAARIFILNDLFVVPEMRRRGFGSALLQEAAEFARAASAVRLQLSTAATNETAQAVYEREGWRRDQTFHVYHFPL